MKNLVFQNFWFEIPSILIKIQGFQSNTRYFDWNTRFFIFDTRFFENMWQSYSIGYDAHLSNYIFGRLYHIILLLFLAKPYLAKKERIICRKNKTSSTGSGYEEFTKCTTDAAANSIIADVNSTDDMYGKTQLMNNSIGDVIAREFWDHRSCKKLRETTRRKMKKKKKIKKKISNKFAIFNLVIYFS